MGVGPGYQPQSLDFRNPPLGQQAGRVTAGWRLPSVVELSGVWDTLLSAPFDSASVFTGVHSANYWSAISGPVSPTSDVWTVDFKIGGVLVSGTGGACAGEVTVGVPFSLGKGVIAIDDGPAYGSTVLLPGRTSCERERLPWWAALLNT